MAVAGSGLKVYFSTGPVGTPVYTALSCEVSASMSMERDLLDSSGKCSDNKTYEYGLFGWTMSVDGVYTASDSGVDEIRDNCHDSDKALIQYKTFGGEIRSGTVLVSNFTTDSAVGDVVKWSASLTGDGALTIA